MGATFQNRWEENQKKLYSKEAEGKARGKNKKAFTRLLTSLLPISNSETSMEKPSRSVKRGRKNSEAFFSLEFRKTSFEEASLNPGTGNPASIAIN